MYVNYVAPDGERRLGWFDGERVVRLEGPPTDRLVLDGFPPVPDDAPEETEEIRFEPALLAPGKIICLMRSYRAHAEEGGHEPPPEPMFFAKLRNSLTGHGEPIRLPDHVEGEVHHEGELALVIGAPGKGISPDRAMEHVAAYTVANDVTARTLQRADAARGWPWLRAKSLDTFLPLGPGLVPATEVPDPHALMLRVRVNDEVRQRAETSRLLWPIAEIVASVSRWLSLDAGDLILTGTPEGVGPIRPGDRVEVTIEGLGTLANPVLGDSRRGSRAGGS